MGQDDEPADAIDAESTGAPVARSYRLLGMLSVAAVAAVVLVPYSGLTRLGQADVVRSEDAAAAAPDPLETEPAPPSIDDSDSEDDDGDLGSDYPEGAEVATGAAATTPVYAGVTSSSIPPPSYTPPVYYRPIPTPTTSTSPTPTAPPPSWASSRRTTSAGYIATDVGCADSTSAADLDEFFQDRMRPVLGHDYQHVYKLGGERYLWLFQDTFVDQAGVADELDEATFLHNAAYVQTGRCFTLYHRGSSTSPASFEPGTGERPLSQWFWPLGGERDGDRLFVFWAEMTKDPDPPRGEGLGWHPLRTWLATYDAATFARLSFEPAPNPGTFPIYGYAVSSDSRHTYLFGNTYDQNLARQGGWESGPHSATHIWLARVPRGQLDATPQYRTASGWSNDPSDARSIVSRFWAENPMQPRRLGGQWVAATKRDGFWGEELFIDVARDPWGPWTTVSRTLAEPRNGDPLMNTYHAHLMPWLEQGSIVVSMSQNARDMVEDAFPHPERYRLLFLRAPLVPPPPAPPPPPPPPPSTTTTVRPRPPTTTSPPRTTTTTTPRTTTTTTATTTTPPTTDPCATTTTTATTLPGETTTTTTTLPGETTTTTTSPCPPPP